MDDNRTQQQVHPLPQSYGGVSNYADANDHDQEYSSGTRQSKEYLRRKQRMKCLAYVLVFAAFQTGIILLFTLTVMKIRSPKFRVKDATFEKFEVGAAADPAFHLRMNAQVRIKNTNFGTFKFKSTPIDFFYDGIPVGQSILPAAQAQWRTTRKLNVVVDLSSDYLTNKTQLGNDLNSGILKLNALSTLGGKVRVTLAFVKKKTANMNCTIAVALADRAVREIICL